MSGFHEALHARHVELLDRFRPHPFMVQVVDGSFPAERFERWICQDYLWVRQLERFLNQLAARAPRRLRRSIFETALNVGGNIETFEQMAGQKSIDLTETRMSFAGHAYASFLLATVFVRSFGESIAACYATHCAYLESWQTAMQAQTKPSPWQAFIEQRTSAELQAWVARLARFTDLIAEEATPEQLALMSESFRQALHYQLRCFETALEGKSW